MSNSIEKYEDFRLDKMKVDDLRIIYRRLEIDNRPVKSVYMLKKSGLVDSINNYCRKNKIDIIELVNGINYNLAKEKVIVEPILESSIENEINTPSILPFFIPKKIDCFSDLWLMNVGEILYLEDFVDLNRCQIREIERWTIDDPNIISYTIAQNIHACNMKVYCHIFTAIAPGSTLAMCGYTERIINISIR